MISIRGSAGAFASIRDRLRPMANGTVMDQIKKAMGQAAITEIGLEFRQERDPYNNGWAPLKHRKGQILSLTGRMRRSFSYEVTPSGFRIGSPVKYVIFHQGGTSGGKTRFQPIDGSGRFVKRKSRSRKPRQGLSGLHVGVRAVTSGALPARMMVPSKALGLGERWTRMFQQTSARTVRRLLKKR